MIASFAIALGFIVVVAVICGVTAAFVAHEYIWDLLPGNIASGLAGVMGGGACAALVFIMFWSLNPDPPRDNAGQPTIGATATMTGFSGIIWLPLYLYAYRGIARRRGR